jgi:hypothetical protein
MALSSLTAQQQYPTFIVMPPFFMLTPPYLPVVEGNPAPPPGPPRPRLFPPLDKLHHHVRNSSFTPRTKHQFGFWVFCILYWHNGNTVSGPSLKVTKARDFSTPFFYKGKKSVICPGTGRKGSIVPCVFSVAAK